MKKTVVILLGLFCVSSVYANGLDTVPDLELEAEAQTEADDGKNSLLKNHNVEMKVQHITYKDQHIGNQSALRASIRLFGQLELSPSFDLLSNIRLRAEKAESVPFSVRDNVHLDVQELALRYHPDENWTWVAGRANIRNGIASGFNPTDWFKDNSLVLQSSLAASDRREDRLGVVTLQAIWKNDLAMVHMGYRPKLDHMGSFFTEEDNVAELAFKRTNPRNSYFVKVSPSQTENFVWSLNAYQEGKNQTGFGAELSYAVSESTILYSEWFVKKRHSLLDEILYNDKPLQFYHQLSTGVLWSIPLQSEDVSLGVEFHFNEAGLSRKKLSQWIHNSDTTQKNEIARRASVHQEPLSRQQWFGRFAWNDILRDTNLNLISTYNHWDKSGFVQLGLNYAPTDSTQVELLAYQFFGSTNTSYGSVSRRQGSFITFTKKF